MNTFRYTQYGVSQNGMRERADQRSEEDAGYAERPDQRDRPAEGDGGLQQRRVPVLAENAGRRLYRRDGVPHPPLEEQEQQDRRHRRFHDIGFADPRPDERLDHGVQRDAAHE